MKTATRPLTIACIALLANLASAAEQPPPERAAAAREALSAWFECVECTDGELENLLRYQREVEDALIVALRKGPSPAKQAELESELRSELRKTPAREEARFVATALANADIAYRVRAIKALETLKTKKARDALKEAARVRPATTVSKAAERALASMPR